MKVIEINRPHNSGDLAFLLKKLGDNHQMIIEEIELNSRVVKVLQFILKVVASLQLEADNLEKENESLKDRLEEEGEERGAILLGQLQEIVDVLQEVIDLSHRDKELAFSRIEKLIYGFRARSLGPDNQNITPRLLLDDAFC